MRGLAVRPTWRWNCKELGARTRLLSVVGRDEPGPRARAAAAQERHRGEPAPRSRPEHHAEAARDRPAAAAAAHRFREAAVARGAGRQAGGVQARAAGLRRGDPVRLRQGRPGAHRRDDPAARGAPASACWSIRRATTISRYKGASIITPNVAELREVVGRWKDEKDLKSRAQALRAKLGLEALLLTRGEDGMTLFSRSRILNVKAEAREVFDVTGAGDTVIATLAVMLAAGAGLEAAVRIANRAAGIVVGKLGTATASAAELFPEMSYYIVTGAAGFIGSKLVEGLNRRGITEIIAVDNLQHADKFRNLAGCEIADYVDQAEFIGNLRALRGRGRRGVPPGRVLRHHGDRRPLHDAEQLRVFEAAARMVPGERGAADLRLVGLGVRRGPGIPRGAALREAAQRLRLLQVPVRPAGAPAPARMQQRRSPASATSTSTARTKRTRGAWRRWPTTPITSSSAAAR